MAEQAYATLINPVNPIQMYAVAVSDDGRLDIVMDSPFGTYAYAYVGTKLTRVFLHISDIRSLVVGDITYESYADVEAALLRGETGLLNISGEPVYTDHLREQLAHIPDPPVTIERTGAPVIALLLIVTALLAFVMFALLFWS